MTQQEIMEMIKKIEEEMSTLPYGGISTKEIGGKKRYYHQYYVDGKRKYEIIPEDQVEEMRGQIERYNELKIKLKRLNVSLAKPIISTPINTLMFECNVMIGDALIAFAKKVSKWEKRTDFSKLKSYLFSENNDRVCVIFGLRRTGKSTMLRQAIADMKKDEARKAVYIKMQRTDNMAMLNSDLKQLHQYGYKYVFIDEVTLMEDFVDSAALFSDIFATMGMKIVLSGTDSLGFWFAEKEELYDRIQPNIHTTFIPFSEFSRVLGINDIDSYIHYGGTLRVGEVAFDDKDAIAEDASFRDDETTRRYIDTAICKNIQHSLSCYQSGGHFSHLYSLYEANELTGAINRIIEDMNHRFVIKVLQNDFKSNDLRLSAANLRKDRNPERRNESLDLIDTNEVTKKLMEILEIKNRTDRSIGITNEHIIEIKQYLRALDLIVDCPMQNAELGLSPEEHILFTQPGMRYCQAQALIHSLMKDEYFMLLSEQEKSYISNRILEEVRGRMMEDIVLLETYKALNNKRYQVFKLRFERGEFDMVVYDKEAFECRIYEIKHNKEIAKEQVRHLVNQEMLSITEKRWGTIVGKYVIYRGESNGEDEQGITYLNVEQYLNDLTK